MQDDGGRNGPGLNLVKLCVGAEEVADLRRWQLERSLVQAQQGQDPRPFHVTRQWPRRAEELLEGGSLYWVFKGVIRARQRIEDIREHLAEDGLRRCALVLGTDIIETEAAPRRPFQGWRYLAAADAPADLVGANSSGGIAARKSRAAPGASQEELPEELRQIIARFGVR
ncbi:MAG: DUF1489 domain-containing protein [Neomegalonema sp.]|nr:DUF1489 domain-containing protein [Neomegalonema sp.]